MNNDICISDIVQIITVIVALVFGIVSISQGNKQIRISNKQTMFDRRYSIYILLQHMDELCTKNLGLLHTKGDLLAGDFIASCLTNSVHFYKICSAFKQDPLGNNQIVFLSLIEELKDFGVQSKLLFPQNDFSYIYNYFNNYANFLTEMRKYSVLLTNVQELPKTMIGSEKDIVKAQHELLHGELATSIESDVLQYKNALEKLHSDYERTADKLEQYLVLVERG